MQELRWILLLVGMLFLVVLAGFEMLRARRKTPREPFPHLEHAPPLEPPHASAHASPAPRAPVSKSSEPHLGALPEGFVQSSDLDGAAVEPIRAQRGGPPLTELPQMSAVHTDVAKSEFSEGFEGSATSESAVSSSDAAQVLTARTMEDTIPVEAREPLASPTPSESQARPQPQGSQEAQTLQEPQGLQDPQSLQESLAASAPRVEWPPDGERQIFSVRIVSSSEQRLPGRSVRQALAACGFVHGRYHIFHQAAEDGRVVLSCASLSKPGSFDPASMDFQRYSGLSVFAVLPGPLPAPATLERLLETGRDLSQRLQARLLDEHGEPLDAVRIAALRAVGGEPGA